MRVAVVTGREPHHKHLCSALAAAHELVAIVHPRRPRRTLASQLQRVRKDAAEVGTVSTLLRVAAARGPLVPWDVRADHERAELRLFPDAEAAYARLDPALVHEPEDVNAPAAVALLRGVAADAVVCLGGPVYREQFLAACPLVLNFHTGLSPLYNGAETIAFAFANGHLRLCGGTLMTMSSVVDGGDVLAHHLPEIAAGDTPGTLFMKAIRGGVDAILAFLNHVAGGGTFARCPQPEPLFYYRSRDWGLAEALRTRQQVQRDAPRLHARPARTVEYWAQPTDADARALLAATIVDLLGLGADA